PHERTCHGALVVTVPPPTASRDSSPILPPSTSSLSFFYNATPPTELYTLSLHDALPISASGRRAVAGGLRARRSRARPVQRRARDRKSTRLNSSHVSISYAVFCLKKKKKIAD